MSCPDCFRGGVSNNHPYGTETTIHGFRTYVAQPEDDITPKGIIVMITDAFGWDFVNNRVLCDHYAKKGGFLVYCPDFMNGWYPLLSKATVILLGILTVQQGIQWILV
jgi:dienelactone hydrolase